MHTKISEMKEKKTTYKLKTATRIQTSTEIDDALDEQASLLEASFTPLLETPKRAITTTRTTIEV